MFLLRRRDDLAAMVKDHEACAGGALVDCPDVFGHEVDSTIMFS
jgi:hypothetical protein